MQLKRQTLPALALGVSLAMSQFFPAFITTAYADMATGLEAFAVKDYKRAYREFESAWKAGDAGAAYNLGMMYDGGYGVSNSRMEAAKWYRLAADRDIVEAMNVLGIAYMRGVGVHKDPHMALELFFRAASKGYAPAQFSLGALYYAGTGPLKTDVQKAIELFTRSANAGHPPAQLALGQLLLEDQYVEMDRIAAWQWLALALEGGERSAQRALDKLATKMTSSEMTKANEALKKIRASRNDSNQNKEINKSE
ncbi:MAG: sel1 repeat family protein [Alphaproteobacteria bacterium]|jgi:uncharacterized protein|nr:sel1 repeat family protein [Alphaproteobacteria bacterium]MBT4084573.1 sel1 repeat family protein [Alphaproteobacteria bacterium]MBT4544620.1 sel1 repeat family protein [Alphaproteobacteria bacterium]MBT7745735.1 sel1 repeat family protein [Alphaproteobacteria bacterium]